MWPYVLSFALRHMVQLWWYPLYRLRRIKGTLGLLSFRKRILSYKWPWGGQQKLYLASLRDMHEPVARHPFFFQEGLLFWDRWHSALEFKSGVAIVISVVRFYAETVPKTPKLTCALNEYPWWDSFWRKRIDLRKNVARHFQSSSTEWEYFH